MMEDILQLRANLDCPVNFNVSTALAVMAGRNPKGAALKFLSDGRWATVSYAELEADVRLLARGLGRAGIRRRARVALMVPPGPDLFALTFALFRMGAVPVLIDPGLGVKRLGRCLEEAEPHAFIGIPKAHVARLLFGWKPATMDTLITVGCSWFWGGTTLEGARRAGRTSVGDPTLTTGNDDPAAILFTSGSTGAPKGAVYTHGMFAAQVAALRDSFAIRQGEVDLPTFPLFALFAPALGMTAVIPDMDFTRPGSVDPREILVPLWDYGATTMFASPALLDRVGRFAQKRGLKVPGLRRVICAGAPVSPKILERFAALLDNEASILTPYGATEALPVSVIDHREILGETRFLTEKGRGVCVGRPLPGMRVAAMQITDEPILRWTDNLALPAGQIGEIVVNGPVVSAGYFGRPADTEAVKMLSRDGIWHRMGDVGYFDDKGRLWFCGRKSHRVETAGGTLFTIPVEGVFNIHPSVKRTALVGVGTRGSQRPVLCVEMEEGAPTDPAALQAELLAIGARYEHTRAIKDILFHKAFPVDIRHNAKIFREQLAAWAESQLNS